MYLAVQYIFERHLSVDNFSDKTIRSSSRRKLLVSNATEKYVTKLEAITVSHHIDDS